MNPETRVQSVLDRALSLARQGFYVHPLGRNKKPLTEHGHLDATTDPDTVATWWTLDFPDALIGVHTGRSGIAVLDLDQHHEDADGFVSLELSWLSMPESWSYSTTTNSGRHTWYRVPQHLNLPPQKDYRKLPGVDRKSGSSYVAVYSTEIPDHLILADAPEWLLDAKDTRSTGDSFEGDLDDYLQTLYDGEPSEKVLQAIERIPDTFDHTELVARQMEFIRLGAEGKEGVKAGLDILRDAWLQEPWNDEDHAWEFDNALATGVKKFGAQSARIANLPKYFNCLQKLGAGSTDFLVGAPRNKAHYFATIRNLAGQPDLNEHEIASLLWNSPANSTVSRDFGIDYLYAQIGAARLKANSPIENPAMDWDEAEKKIDLSLLDADERTQVSSVWSWVGSYMDWATTKVNVINEPYHLQNALSTLACSYGSRIFIPLKSRTMGVNLFQLGLGESSTGKSESISLRDQIVRSVFALDPTYDMGSNPSPEALHEALLKRDHQTSLFNTDEAAGPLNEFLNKSYTAGIVDRLTSYYEGYVAPMLRRGQGGAATNQSAVVTFNIAMYGTPDRVIGLLSRDQFESGFLARFLWTISADIEPDDSQYEESEATERIVAMADPCVDAFADALGRRRDSGRHGSPVLTDQAARERMSLNRKTMSESLTGHEQWSILQPSVRRLGDNIRKMATLLSVGAGSDRVEEHHTLAALELGEMYLRNLESVANRVSASVFERACDEMLTFIVSQGGGCATSRVFHKFRSWELKDVGTALDALVMQGRVKRLEENGVRGPRVEVNYQRLEE